MPLRFMRTLAFELWWRLLWGGLADAKGNKIDGGEGIMVYGTTVEPILR
jgi:hypothetical protein